MMQIAQQYQRVKQAGARVEPTGAPPLPSAPSASAAGLAGQAFDFAHGAYPPLSREGAPPAARAPRFCLPPCCDFSGEPVLAKARETKSDAAGRAGGASFAGRGIIQRGLRAAGACLLLVVAGQALAHSWYPLECCSERDCYAVPASRVQVVPGGWIIDGFPVRHNEARPSPDGRFHICRREDGKGDLIRKEKGPACAWAPMEGS
ncbi:MAG: hypothetical protein ACRDBL_11250 [Rhabdaerophilum sp.]